jgi:hypothetical protein
VAIVASGSKASPGLLKVVTENRSACAEREAGFVTVVLKGTGATACH